VAAVRGRSSFVVRRSPSFVVRRRRRFRHFSEPLVGGMNGDNGRGGCGNVLDDEQGLCDKKKQATVHCVIEQVIGTAEHTQRMSCPRFMLHQCLAYRIDELKTK